MSRGLGKTQLFVLERLKAKGKALSALDIAGDTYYPEHDCWEWQRPTKAKVVSIRRAIRSLEKDGLVHCSLVNVVHYNETEIQLFVWLPEQAPPAERYCRTAKPRLKRDMVEQAITNALSILAQDELATKYDCEDGFYRYSAFTSKASRLLTRTGATWETIQVAIARTIKRMVNDGRIQVRWKKTGINGWIRLNVAQ